MPPLGTRCGGRPAMAPWTNWSHWSHPFELRCANRSRPRRAEDTKARGLACLEQRTRSGLRSGDVHVSQRWYNARVYAKKNVENPLAPTRTEHKGESSTSSPRRRSSRSGGVMLDGPRIMEVLP